MKTSIKDATQKAVSKRRAWIFDQYHNKDKTQEQIANYLGLTRQRVQQILKEKLK